MVALGGESKRKLFLLAPQSFPPLFNPLLVFKQFVCQDTNHSGSNGVQVGSGKEVGSDFNFEFFGKTGGLELEKRGQLCQYKRTHWHKIC